ncbi:hypothetical protein SCHPADRAFT_946591 [Schizopora paradoxa]|uniref:F-box domain-containing protein n=1 Tax=Schizopora paradoxa TaxID=27342 RepID=A0A0H2R222_9AGAM|nr:hypothetical protein SCHPADRAFT_946591 [Schizopora paradoxa]
MLLDLLIKLPNLSSFELEVYDAGKWSGDEALPVTVCPEITSFKLRVQGIYMHTFPVGGSCMEEFMNAIRMPSLESYSISIETNGLGESESKSIVWSQGTGALSRALLPEHFSQSARMRSLYYDLRYNWEYSRMDDEPKVLLGASELHVPLDRFIHAATLIISSFVQVLFTHNFDNKDSKSTDINKPHLRELRFIGCENMTSAHLKRTIDSLELLGAWDDIETVMVQECEHLNYEDVIAVVGDKRLQYFC